ncbi:hypothetical protein CDAR_579201 [Caerostris darwini]|uniref:Uncharacterized protein n=1 Tax=Caerostris darwini TaxID=1538125 RepID=A0AAV4RSK7_9ARAC|nr:hypothetical protein CDAR_579201 [Caerostris darwini]
MQSPSVSPNCVNQTITNELFLIPIECTGREKSFASSQAEVDSKSAMYLLPITQWNYSFPTRSHFLAEKCHRRQNCPLGWCGGGGVEEKL